jgi:hypothetical protein
MCGLLGWQAAEARFTGEYYLGVDLEDHSDAANEFSSLFGLRIRDDIVSPKFETQYDLEARVNYNRENDVINDQYSGDITGRYIFIRPSLWWNYSGEFDVIPLNRVTEIDNLRSQNLSTVSTGPTISLWKNIRGSVDLTALANVTKYSDSNLSSSGEDITLEYIYPYSTVMTTTYFLDYESLNYDDVSIADDDFDWLAAGVTISRETENSRVELMIAYNEIDQINNPSPRNTFEFTMDYQIDRYSNIAMEFSDLLGTADDFNRLDDNPDNAIFASGLIKNERFSLRYGYAAYDSRYSFELYTNNLETVDDTVPATEKISGVVFGFSNDITQNLNLFIGLESTDEEILDVRTDEVLVAGTYTRRHSKRLYSAFELSIENDRVNNVSSNDTQFRYRITSKLF